MNDFLKLNSCAFFNGFVSYHIGIVLSVSVLYRIIKNKRYTSLIQERIEFKVLCLMYKTLPNMASLYLTQLLSQKKKSPNI